MKKCLKTRFFIVLFLIFFLFCLYINVKDKMMKHMKNIIESIRAARVQKKQCKELKASLMADYVEATSIPHIYKVVFEDDFDGGDKYNLYNINEKFYLFNRCKTTLQYLKYGLYYIREHDRSLGWLGGIFDITTQAYVFVPRQSLNIKQFPDSKTGTMLLQTNDELIVFNLETKKAESVIAL